MLSQISRICWSHTRDIHVKTTQTIIKYRIPLYLDMDEIGSLLNYAIKNGSLEIEFTRKVPQINPASREIEGLRVQESPKID